jgi:hypothetical protein
MKIIFQKNEKYLGKKYIPHPQPLSSKERGANENGSCLSQRLQNGILILMIYSGEF